MHHYFICSIFLPVHDLLPYLLKKKWVRNPLVEGFPFDHLIFEVYDFIEDGAISAARHFGQLLDLEDACDSLEWDELERLLEIWVDKFFEKEDEADLRFVHSSQIWNDFILVLDVIEIIKQNNDIAYIFALLFLFETFPSTGTVLTKEDEFEFIWEFKFREPVAGITYTEQIMLWYVSS